MSFGDLLRKLADVADNGGDEAFRAAARQAGFEWQQSAYLMLAARAAVHGGRERDDFVRLAGRFYDLSRGATR